MWASLVALVVKNLPANGGVGSISEPGRSPGGVHGSPLKYSCLEKPTDIGVWWVMVRTVTQSQT